MLLQYSCKHASVGPSPTPAVVNDLTKLSCILSAEHWQFLAIVGRTDFFFVLAALQPPICCSNTAANTLQWVRPRPRRSSMILQNSRAFFRQKIGNFWPLLGELFFFWLAALQPPICCSNTTANTFQWVRPRPRRSSMILFGRPFNPRYVAPILIYKTLGILSAEHDFFLCAGGLATPDMLLQYNCKHVSVGPSPTPAVVNDPTNRSCILSAKSWQFMAIFGRKLIFSLFSEQMNLCTWTLAKVAEYPTLQHSDSPCDPLR